jgi:hypothetical protein
MGAAALAGCAECPRHGYGMSPTASIATPTGPLRRASHAAPTKQGAPEVARKRLLKPRNETRFAVLPDVEAAGRSRSFTGGQSDPDSCAEQCLASHGCNAFSFEKSTRLCYLIGQITEMNANAAFVSGRLR